MGIAHRLRASTAVLYHAPCDPLLWCVDAMVVMGGIPRFARANPGLEGITMAPLPAQPVNREPGRGTVWNGPFQGAWSVGAEDRSAYRLKVQR